MRKRSHAGFDEAKRKRKAAKICAVLETVTSLKKATVLDIGTGSGHIAQEIAKHCKKVVSVDVNDERKVKEGYTFKRVTSEQLPFKNSVFSVVISNQVLEHVDNQQKHIDEIYRVLKKGGICYLATPNKYALLEPHFHLPFLSWLPQSIAKSYLKILTGKTWDVQSPSYARLKKLTTMFSQQKNMLPEIINNPGKFRLDLPITIGVMGWIIPQKILRVCTPMMPSFIMVLRK